MTDQSSYSPLHNKSYRAITYDWDILSSYGASARLYCLTDFQVGWLLSNTEYMRWKTRWQNCPCTQDDMNAMKAELDFNLMNCLDFDPNQLEYVYQTTVDNQLDQFQALYDEGGIAGLNPDTPTDEYSGDGSQERLDALCLACDTYVKSYLDNWLRKARTLLGLTFLLGLAVVVSPLTGIIAAVVIGGLFYVSQTGIDAVSDAEAVEDVICCLYNGLISQDVTSANFETALDGCGFTPGTNRAIVRDIVAADLDQEKNWLSFLNILGDAYQLMQANAPFTCPCAAEWTHVFDFSVDNGDWDIVVLGNQVSGAAGSYVVSSGWQNNPVAYTSSGNTGYYRRLYIEKSFVETHIIDFKAVFNLTKGIYASSLDVVLLMRDEPNTVSLIRRTTEISNGNDLSYTLPFNKSISELRILIDTSHYINNPTYNGLATLKSITIRGTGVDPFL